MGCVEMESNSNDIPRTSGFSVRAVTVTGLLALFLTAVFPADVEKMPAAALADVANRKLEARDFLDAGRGPNFSVAGKFAVDAGHFGAAGSKGQDAVGDFARSPVDELRKKKAAVGFEDVRMISEQDRSELWKCLKPRSRVFWMTFSRKRTSRNMYFSGAIRRDNKGIRWGGRGRKRKLKVSRCCFVEWQSLDCNQNVPYNYGMKCQNWERDQPRQKDWFIRDMLKGRYCACCSVKVPRRMGA